MPERPKRRKNKNKRKNKPNNRDDNKNSNNLSSNKNSDFNANTTDVASISEQNVTILTPNQQSNVQIVSDSTVNDSVSINEDLNNNKSQISIDATIGTLSTENNPPDSVGYVVESPDQSFNSKYKLQVSNKSKSLDNDDGTNIVDITEDSNSQSGDENALALIESQNVLVTLVDSDVEWEKTDDLNDENKSNVNEKATGVLSITTIPLNIAHCDETKSLTPDEEISLRNYLKTLNLATHPELVNSVEIKAEIEQIINREIKQRLRKKAMVDDFVIHRLGPSRILDVIDEEGSSESSITSRRQSYLSDKKSDCEDLEDDVFEDKNKITKMINKVASTSFHKKTLGKLLPQQCVLVDTKIKDLEVSEARGDWTTSTMEKMDGAEVVYLTDTSSSTSSLHEIGEDNDDVDTDASVRMITPTIEVTDTENFLKKTFVAETSEENHKKEEILNHENSKNIDLTKIDNKNVAPENESQNQEKNIMSDDGIEKSKTEIDKTIEVKSNKVSNFIEALINPTKSYVNYIKNTVFHDPSKDKVKNNTMIEEENLKISLQKQNSSERLGILSDKERVVPVEFEQTSSKSHEIEVLSIDNIKTNLYVKKVDIIHDVANSAPSTKKTECFNKNQMPLDLKAKVIKCEFNDAINNLIREVSSDQEEVNENCKETLTRQDSSSSMGSSQCTAKYNPNYSSLNDISNFSHDEPVSYSKSNIEPISSSTSHVKDVFEYVAGATNQSNRKFDDSYKQPSKLKDLCVKNIATLPYGDKILEELASVSERLQKITRLSTISKQSSITKHNNKMPHYLLPDISSIEKVTLPSHTSIKEPPPIKPRHSSLKKSHDEVQDNWTGIPTKAEPLYVCLSPSQKMLMEKTNTVITKEDASQLIEMHKKYIDRRGYNEQIKSDTDENNSNSPPIIPFKSQTGSRLLALIRDPAITRNIHTINERLNSSHDTLKTNNVSSRASDFVFKPIPPPRPRKYSAYESDESSDFTDTSLRSMKSERKFFHYSTGNLSKEIENDVSTIQNMHRFLTDTRDELPIGNYECPRRPSLPRDLCEQQMEYIRQKEKEVEAEIERLENMKVNSSYSQKKGPRAPLVSEKDIINEHIKDPNNYFVSRKKESSIPTSNKTDCKKNKLSSLFSSSEEEIRRERMYSEYVTQMAQREERKQHKLIKITNSGVTSNSKSMSALDLLESKVNNRIEKEFICKARERWDKLGIKDPETEDERDLVNVYKEPKVVEHKIKVIESGKLKDVKKLPSHLQDFVHFTAKDQNSNSSSAIWRPGAPTSIAGDAERSPGAPPPPPPPPIWMPSSTEPSPQTPRKTFRPVHFEETPPSRRKFGNLDHNGCTSGSESEGRLRTSHSAPVTGLNSLGGSSVASRLPKAQNPTVTLLQKAREGQLTRGSNYGQQERDAARLPRDRPSPPRSDPVHALRKGYNSEGEVDRSDYERGGIRKMADAHRKVEGIGPTTKDGMPVTLRSEVKDPSKWYKKMYDTIHKNKYDDDYVTIRYKSRRLLGQPERPSSNKSQYAYFDPRSGYLSEPEGGLSRLGSSTWSDAYDSDAMTGPRRRTASVQEERRISDATSPYLPSNNKYSTLASARASQEVYKNQPGRIENYIPGKSSVVDKESKQWWDEVMDIFDGQNISSTTSLPQASPKEKKDLTSNILSKSNMARALKESGYESDSTLVFRRREDTEAPLSPAERRAAYRDLQAGGEPPLRGFRSPAPPRQESPRRYVESDVNIHYRCPVRHDPLPLVPERELARQQAEHMKRLYREQKRNKYLQELQDMQNRRHQDNFTPSQKTILPLNRYDEADKVVAKALYTFNGQTSRELSFRKGELIYVRRQIDSNWYEGELHGRIGLFPYNYVEIQKGDVAVQPVKKPSVIEGRARAKFDFTAQTNLELPLKKGEIVVLTRRIDQNWWEGRNSNKTGIFPDSYVTVLQEPSPSKPEPQTILSTDKPVASPAAHGLLNGTAKRSMGSHSYTPQPNSPALSNAPPATQPLPGYVAKPAQATLTPSDRGYGPPTGPGVDLNNTEPLYVDTNAEAIPYRAMYKYRPQNPDELELNEGDTVYVLEKCDDGWYVGSSQRSGRFGTFPGNYVERI